MGFLAPRHAGWDAAPLRRGAGTHIADPHNRLTLDQYEARHGKTLPRRIPLDEFIAYGLWYQRRAVPEVDESTSRADRLPDRAGFDLALDDGSTVTVERVVVATGFEGYVLAAARVRNGADVSRPALLRGPRHCVFRRDSRSR